jgi:hypothetical protein
MPFPFGRYCQYFQFGVVSSRIIANDHWSVDLKDPRLLRKTGWNFVDIAWSIEGDFSYLDGSWMWGGAPYRGVTAQYHRNPLENPYEVIFFYNGQTLPSGTVLWQCRNPNILITTADSSVFSQLASEVLDDCTLCFSIWIVLLLSISHAYSRELLELLLSVLNCPKKQPKKTVDSGWASPRMMTMDLCSTASSILQLALVS